MSLPHDSAAQSFHTTHWSLVLLAAQREGMSPMRHEALRLIAEDTTTISEVIRSIYTL